MAEVTRKLAHEVVMGEVERHSSLQVRQLLAEALVNRVERRIYIRMVGRELDHPRRR